MVPELCNGENEFSRETCLDTVFREIPHLWGIGPLTPLHFSWYEGTSTCIHYASSHLVVDWDTLTPLPNATNAIGGIYVPNVQVFMTAAPTLAPNATVSPTAPTIPSPTYSPTEPLVTDGLCEPRALANYDYMSRFGSQYTNETRARIDSYVAEIENAFSSDYADEVDLLNGICMAMSA